MDIFAFFTTKKLVQGLCYLHLPYEDVHSVSFQKEWKWQLESFEEKQSACDIWFSALLKISTQFIHVVKAVNKEIAAYENSSAFMSLVKQFHMA